MPGHSQPRGSRSPRRQSSKRPRNRSSGIYRLKKRTGGWRTQKMSRGGFQITEKTGKHSKPFQLGGGGEGSLPPSEKFLKFDQYLMPFAVNSRK